MGHFWLICFNFYLDLYWYLFFFPKTLKTLLFFYYFIIFIVFFIVFYVDHLSIVSFVYFFLHSIKTWNYKVILFLVFCPWGFLRVWVEPSFLHFCDLSVFLTYFGEKNRRDSNPGRPGAMPRYFLSIMTPSVFSFNFFISINLFFFLFI